MAAAPAFIALPLTRVEYADQVWMREDLAQKQQ
jgi:hypothetical protein